MSIQIKFCNYKQQQKLYDKKDLSNITTYEGFLLDGFTLKNASFDVEESTIVLNNYNYVIIESFGRCYFIDSILNIGNGFSRVSISCDVLMSAYNIINNSYSYILRADKISDKTLKDETMTFSDEDTIIYKNLDLTPNPTITPKSLDSFKTHSNNDNDYCFIVAVIDVESDQNYPYDYYERQITYYNTDSALGLDNLHDDVSAEYGSALHNTIYYLLNLKQVSGLLGVINNDNTLKTWIKYIRAIPCDILNLNVSTLTNDFFNMTGIGWISRIHIGDDKYAIQIEQNQSDLDNVYVCNAFNIDLFMGDIKLTSSDYVNPQKWMNFEPYAKYQLFLPYYDFIDINLKDYLNRNIFVVYGLNLVNDEQTIFLYDVDNTKSQLIAKYKINLGVSVAVDSSNLLQYKNYKESAKLSTGIQLGLSGLSMATGVGLLATGIGGLAGVGMLASGVNGVINSSVSYTNQMRNMYKTGDCQITSGNVGMYASQKPFLKIIYKEPTTAQNSNYKYLYGEPYYKYAKLNTFNSFIKCDKIRFPNYVLKTGNSQLLDDDLILDQLTLSESEFEELNVLMQNGFYHTI